MADGIIQPQRREAYFASPLAMYGGLLIVLRDHHAVAVGVVHAEFA
jgi:hypothetical protein